MSRIAVIGESPRVDFYRTAGATVLVAEGPEAVRAAWESIPADVAVVVLSASAATHLPELARSPAHHSDIARPQLLTAVLP